MRPPMRLVLAVPGLVLLASAACGGGGGTGAGGGCPSDLPASCPADAPGYAATIAPLIQRRCAECHIAGGAASDRPFDTWAAVNADRRTVLSEVYNCKMPEPGATPLTAQERADLLGWLVCGAQDN